MLIIRIKGGFGNQLFQYASAYALAKRTGHKLVLDNSFFPKQKLRGFKLEKLCLDDSVEVTGRVKCFAINVLKNPYINKAIRLLHMEKIYCGYKTVYLSETHSAIIKPYYSITGKEKMVYMEGYYQSEEYFKEFRDELMQQICRNYPSDAEYERISDKIKSCNSVAVHLRRGDFLKAQYNKNPRHYLLGEKYYINSIKYVREKVENPQFFWFSDDIGWVKNVFGERKDFHFVTMKTENADIDELFLMSECKHIIAANSTFSWWASWLNKNETALHICPDRRYGNESMIPDTWIKLPVV